MKRKRWLIPAALILSAVILCVVFFPTLKIYAAPKTALTSALTNTVAMLESRLSAGPAAVMLKAFDPNGKNTVGLSVDASDPLLGTAQYDMTVQIEQSPRRIFISGDVVSQGKPIDLSIYLDSDFAALSSAGLLQGNYYGLTYDTFSEDVRNSMLLRLFLGDDLLQTWETKIDDLDRFMSKSIDIPSFSKEDIRKMILGIVALKANVEQQSIRINGNERKCFEICFEATGTHILDGLAYLQTDIPVSISPDDELSVSFYVCKDVVVKIEAELDSDDSNTKLTLVLGENPSADDLHLLYQNPQGYTELAVSTQYNESEYNETVSYSQSQTNTRSDISVNYCWNRNNGQMELDVSREEGIDTLSLQLLEENDGFSLETGDFEGLMHILIDRKDDGDSPCTMYVRKGAEIKTPAYKNFDQWSMEDMTILLGSIGSLLGLKIG